MMATVPHVTSGLGLRKFQTDGFLLTRVYLMGYTDAEMPISERPFTQNYCAAFSCKHPSNTG